MNWRLDGLHSQYGVFWRRGSLTVRGRIEWYFGSSPSGPDAPRAPLYPMFCTKLEEPCSFSKVPDGPHPSMTSGSKKKEPRCVCPSEAKASHSHKMWAEVSSSVPHFLQVGLLLSPNTCRCLLKVLCPVSRPITALDCVLLKNNDWAPVARY